LHAPDQSAGRDQKERDEQETLVEDYLQAIKGASSVAKAA